MYSSSFHHPSSWSSPQTRDSLSIFCTRKILDRLFIKPREKFFQLVHDAFDNKESEHYKPFHRSLRRNAEDVYARGLLVCKSYTQDSSFEYEVFKKHLFAILGTAANISEDTEAILAIKITIANFYRHLEKMKQTDQFLKGTTDYFAGYKFQQFVKNQTFNLDQLNWWLRSNSQVSVQWLEFRYVRLSLLWP